MKNQNGLRAATWKGDRILYITQAGIIAAIYVVLTVVFAPLAFKEIQVRFAEMLTILPFFFPAAVPGVFIGCIIGNILYHSSVNVFYLSPVNLIERLA